jgi:hypothetical protein
MIVAYKKETTFLGFPVIGGFEVPDYLANSNALSLKDMKSC